MQNDHCNIEIVLFNWTAYNGAYAYSIDNKSASSGTVVVPKGNYFCFVMSGVSNTAYGRTATIRNNDTGTNILSIAASTAGYPQVVTTTVTFTTDTSITCSAEGYSNVAFSAAIIIPYGN